MAAFLDHLSPAARDEFFALIDARIEGALSGVTASDTQPWMSVAEAAERLRISQGALRQAIRRGAIPCFHFERRVLLRAEDVDGFPTRGR